METQLRVREKVKARDIPVGDCLREIEKTRAYQVVDLTQVDMFKQPAEGQVLALRDDVVYVVDVETGIVGIVPKEQAVYHLRMKAIEVD